MPSPRTLNRIGSWAFIAVGAGHLASQLAAPQSPAHQRIVAAMQAFAIDMPGRTGNLYEYHVGFSVTMGFLLMAYGALALLSGRSQVEERPILILHTLVAATAATLSASFFFAVPLVLTLIALAAYATALLQSRRNAH
ncbi:MAG: hypothetical protein KGZ83_07805 [Sulfuricella sp.]|nr:hypothetical protein [Sulfuricella sp.]